MASTRLDGMAGHLVVGASHTGLLRYRPAIEATLAFLDGGGFGRPREP